MKDVNFVLQIFKKSVLNLLQFFIKFWVFFNGITVFLSYESISKLHHMHPGKKTFKRSKNVAQG